MSIKQEGEYLLSLAQPLFPGDQQAPGFVWPPIDDADTFQTAAEDSKEILTCCCW